MEDVTSSSPVPSITLAAPLMYDYVIFVYYMTVIIKKMLKNNDWCRIVQMWPDILQKAKHGGLNVIQTYVFWNAHEPQQGKVYN
jgi:hypothetical protein